MKHTHAVGNGATQADRECCSAIAAELVQCYMCLTLPGVVSCTVVRVEHMNSSGQSVPL